MKHFGVSFAVSVLCLGLAAWWGYSHAGVTGALIAFGIALILGAMEVSLSFDNAVVNASVLKTWDPLWQRIFLTVGILIAVFGMRLVFPLVIVAMAADLGMGEVWRLALHDPQQFSAYLSDHHNEVAVFGGIFLLLVALNFLMDESKELHWLGHVEAKLASFGRVGSVPVLVALLVVMASLGLVDEDREHRVLLAGVWGIITYVAVDFISAVLERDGANGAEVGTVIRQGGIGGFLYLEILDASFSFDGVIGAFAITSDVVIIMLGLAIGAMFVRSMTVYLVRRGTLDEYVFLEHGAHYAIGLLALIMFASIRYHVPELVTGLLGIAFILASLWSSVRYRRHQQQEER